VEPILASNRAWLASYHNPLTIARRTWLEAGEDPNKLLRGDALTAAEEYADKHPADILPEEKEFLAESRRREEQRSAGRRRIFALIAIIAILILSGLTAWALKERSRATANATQAGGNAATAVANLATATVARSTAEAAKETAEAGSTQAAQSEATATASLAKAVVAQLTATVAQGMAEADRNLADARRLAAQGRGQLDVDTRLAAQLAAESDAIRATWESSSLLLDLVLSAGGNIIQQYGPPIPPAESLIYDVALSPDGRRLAWGSLQGVVSVWDYQKNAMDSCSRKHGGNVLSLAFSPNGKWLASGGVKPELFIWDMDSCKKVQPLDVSNRVYDVAFSPSGDRLAAVNLNEIRIFRTDTWEEIRQMRFPAEPDWISDIAWSPNGKWLATAEFADQNPPNNGLVVWDVAARQKKLSFPKQRTLYGLDWAPNGRFLAAGSTDGKVTIIDMAADLSKAEEINSAIPATNQEVRGVAFSPDGKVLARGGQDNVVTLFSIPGFREIARIASGGAGYIQGLAFYPEEGFDLLAVIHQNDPVGRGYVSLNLIAPESPLSAELAAGEGALKGLAWTPEGKARLLRLLEGAGLAWVTEVDSAPQGAIGAETIRLQKEGEFRAAALSPQGDRLALWEQDGPVQIYELSSKKLLQTLPLGNLLGTSLAFNNDGSILAAGACSSIMKDEDDTVHCLNAEIQLWESGSGSRIAQTQPMEYANFIRSLAFSQDGDWLASGIEDGSILIWDLANNKQAGDPLTRHKEPVSSLAFSPDGQRLVSGSEDNTVILWDWDTRQPLGSPLLGDQSRVTALAFRDEGALLAGYEDGRVLEWDLRLQRWIEIACSLAGESLSEEDQGLYFPEGGYRDVCGK
jgi:WD40 repeat protein